MTCRLMAILAIELLIVAAIPAQTLLVPSQYASIQAAINAAPTGATVLVSPGTYIVSALSFGGKAITLKGANGSAATTLNGNLVNRVLWISSGEGPGTVIQGFTVTNGSPTGVFGPGAGILCTNASPTFIDVVVTNCSGPFVSATAPPCHGGGVAVINGSPTFTNCRFTNNKAGSYGEYYILPGVLGQYAGRHGGGVYLNLTGPSCVFRNCIFASNSSGESTSNGGSQNPLPFNSGDGGAVAMENAFATFEDCTFTSNVTGAGGHGSGGAVAAKNSTLTIVRSSFSSNLARSGLAYTSAGKGNGGAIDAEGSMVTIERSSFTANTASMGSFSTPPVGTLFSLSRSPGNGGAVAIRGGGFFLATDSSFVDNAAGDATGDSFGDFIAGRGGAISAEDTDVILRRSTFTGNRAGNAILFSTNGPHPNASGGTGGAVDAMDSETFTDSCVFAFNSTGGGSPPDLTYGYPQGGAIRASSQNLSGGLHIRRSTFFENGTGPMPPTVPTVLPGASIAVVNVPSVTVSDSILREDAPAPYLGIPAMSYCNVQGGHPGSNLIDLDPMFVAPLAKRFGLAHGSPCIDAGNPALMLTSTDIDGDPRVAGGRIDMGADEAYRSGTADDVLLATTLNGQGSATAAQKVAVVGDILYGDVLSSNVALSSSPVYLIVQLHAVNDPPTPNVDFPFVYVDLSEPYALVAAPTTASLPLLSATIPAGLGGTALRIQGFVVSSSATNEIFAATSAHEIVMP